MYKVEPLSSRKRRQLTLFELNQPNKCRQVQATIIRETHSCRMTSLACPAYLNLVCYEIMKHIIAYFSPSSFKSTFALLILGQSSRSFTRLADDQTNYELIQEAILVNYYKYQYVTLKADQISSLVEKTSISISKIIGEPWNRKDPFCTVSRLTCWSKIIKPFATALGLKPVYYMQTHAGFVPTMWDIHQQVCNFRDTFAIHFYDMHTVVLLFILNNSVSMPNTLTKVWSALFSAKSNIVRVQVINNVNFQLKHVQNMRCARGMQSLLTAEHRQQFTGMLNYVVGNRGRFLKHKGLSVRAKKKFANAKTCSAVQHSSPNKSCAIAFKIHV